MRGIALVLGDAAALAFVLLLVRMLFERIDDRGRKP